MQQKQRRSVGRTRFAVEDFTVVNFDRVIADRGHARLFGVFNLGAFNIEVNAKNPALEATILNFSLCNKHAGPP